jgi:hypothetical protein
MDEKVQLQNVCQWWWHWLQIWQLRLLSEQSLAQSGLLCLVQ